MNLQATTMEAWALRGQTPMVRVGPAVPKPPFMAPSTCELVSRSPVLNAQASAQHLSLILQAVPERPILLFWDRAPWHHGQPIRQLLQANPRLTIIEYPVAAPDLHPQEQVWKLTCRPISHNHTIPKLPDLADRFHQHLSANTFYSSFLERYGFYFVCPFLN